jgi:hypothetical protein
VLMFARSEDVPFVLLARPRDAQAGRSGDLCTSEVDSRNPEQKRLGRPMQACKGLQ